VGFMIKFVDLKTGIKVELMINNIFGIMNSELIRNYCLFDSRVIILINIVKDWSKRREINGNIAGYLSSYCYTLLVIYFLQRINVLPVLKSNEKVEDYVENLEKNGFTRGKSISYSISELLYHFFVFLLEGFNEEDFCIDITQPEPILRYREIFFLNYKNSAEAVYCIIDPVDYSYNPSSYFIRNSTQQKKFSKELEIAIEKIKKSEWII
jgi:DNA polymerase sigma